LGLGLVKCVDGNLDTAKAIGFDSVFHLFHSVDRDREETLLQQG